MKKLLLSLSIIITHLFFNCYTGNCCAGTKQSKPYKHQPMHKGLSQTVAGYPIFNGLYDDESENDDVNDAQSSSIMKSSSETNLDEKVDLDKKYDIKPLKSILKTPTKAAAIITAQQEADNKDDQKEKKVSIDGDIKTKIN